MIRKLITIDEEKCNGCGLCAAACHEGAIGMVEGKARLLREDYCDGLGDCLPACPTGAISFEEREAPAYNEAAVQAAKAAMAQTAKAAAAQAAKAAAAQAEGCQTAPAAAVSHPAAAESRLTNWPVQIRLAPVKAPYFQNAHLLVAADCTAFACGDFHSRFVKNHVVLVGCPKLDPVDYAEKLAAILRENGIQSIQVVRMTVPCCGGMVQAVKRALEASGKDIPCQVAVLAPDGQLQEDASRALHPAAGR